MAQLDYACVTDKKKGKEAGKGKDNLSLRGYVTICWKLLLTHHLKNTSKLLKYLHRLLIAAEINLL